MIEMATWTDLSSSLDNYIWNFPINFSNNNYYLSSGVHRYINSVYTDDDVLHGTVYFLTKSTSQVKAKMTVWNHTYNESRVYLFAKGY